MSQQLLACVQATRGGASAPNQTTCFSVVLVVGVHLVAIGEPSVPKCRFHAHVSRWSIFAFSDDVLGPNPEVHVAVNALLLRVLFS